MAIRLLFLLAVVAYVVFRLLPGLRGLGRPSGTGPRPRSEAPGEPSDDPWTVLGVAPGASAAAVREAYQRAMQDYHPDQVAHLGTDLRRLAEQRTKAITAAYAKLRPRRRR